MTENPRTPPPHADGPFKEPGAKNTRHTVVIPASVDMVNVLGPGDEFLGIMEGEFDADIHVRGNQFVLHGVPSEIALIERFLQELVTVIRTGQGVTNETVERIISMLR